MIATLFALQMSLATSAVQEQMWSRDVALAKLRLEGPLHVKDVPGFVAAIGNSDTEVRLAAARFWASRSDDVESVYRDQLAEEGIQDYQPLSDMIEAVAIAIDEAVDDRDPIVAKEALRTLCALGTPASVVCPPYGRCGTGLGSTFEGQTYGKLHERAQTHSQTLATFADDGDATVVLNALRSLSQADLDGLQGTVMGLLSSADKYKRAVGLSLLSIRSDKVLFDTVAPLLDDSDEEVRESAKFKFQRHFSEPVAAFPLRWSWSPNVRAVIAEGIGNHCEGKERSRMLTEMLSDPVGHVRAAALGGLRSEEDSPSPLSERKFRVLLGDPYGPVRRSALQELLGRNVADSERLAREGMTDSDRDVRSSALCYFEGNFDLSDTPMIVKAVELGVDYVYSPSNYFAHRANDKFMDSWIKSGSVDVRRSAAFAIMYYVGEAERPEIDRDRLIAHLFRMVRDPDSEVMRYVIYGLGALRTSAGVDMLIEIGRCSEGDQLVNVISRLGEFRNRESQEFIQAHSSSQDSKVRIASRQALR